MLQIVLIPILYPAKDIQWRHYRSYINYLYVSPIATTNLTVKAT